MDFPVLGALNTKPTSANWRQCLINKRLAGVLTS